MFTGIVRERGRVVAFDGSRLVVKTGADAEIGDSVAIAGVCLTVAERDDGTSLTVAALDDAGFAVALVPHTLEATTLGTLEPGDNVNLEADVIGKYVERLTMNR